MAQIKTNTLPYGNCLEVRIQSVAKNGHTLSVSDLEKAGLDPDWIEERTTKAEKQGDGSIKLVPHDRITGMPDCEGAIVVQWNRHEPLPIERLVEVAERPTDHMIMRRTKELQSSAEVVAEITAALTVARDRAPTPKEIKDTLRDNAKADLFRSRHQLAGLITEAALLIVEELTRLKLKKAGTEEKDIRKLGFGPGTDVYIISNSSGGNRRSRPIPLALADEEFWKYARQGDGKSVTGTYAYWGIQAPKPRRGSAPDMTVCRVCRTGFRAEGEYVPEASFVVYYRMPNYRRRGAIVAIPMKLFKEALRLKYKFIVDFYSDWMRGDEQP